MTRRSLSLVAPPVLATLLALALLVAPRAQGSAPPPAPTTARCPTGRVALTFDDGPSRANTPTLVGTLQRLHVPAAFFMVGSQVAAAPATARAVHRAGLLIGNQTYHHERLTALSDARIRATLRSTQRLMRATGLHPSDLVRPPYGAIDDRVRRVVHGLGLVPVLWDVDPRDWAGGTARAIARRVLDALRPHQRNIVLLHDGVANSPASIAAVPRIVRVARSRGYCFVGLGENGQPTAPA